MHFLIMFQAVKQFELFTQCVLFSVDNIDETYGVNVQFEESDDDVSCMTALCVLPLLTSLWMFCMLSM